MLHCDVWFCKWGIENSILCVCVCSRKDLLSFIVFLWCQVGGRGDLAVFFPPLCVQQTAELGLCVRALYLSLWQLKEGVCVWCLYVSCLSQQWRESQWWCPERLRLIKVKVWERIRNGPMFFISQIVSQSISVFKVEKYFLSAISEFKMGAWC